MKPTAPLAILALTLAGCATSPDSPQEMAGQVKQVMRCTVKEGADPAAVVAVANDFAKLPGVLDVVAGVDPSGAARPVTSPGNVVTFILTYRNEDTYLNTVQGPAYQNLKDAKLSALCGDVTDYPVTLRQYEVAQTYKEETTATDLERRSAAAELMNRQIRRTK